MSYKPTIAVADDNEYLTELLEVRFKAEGWKTVRFARGGDVRRHLLRNAVDLLLLDIELPDISGLEVLRKIRADRFTIKMSVFMLTSHTETSDVKKAVALGANGYVAKPFNMEELVLRVAREIRMPEKFEMI